MQHSKSAKETCTHAYTHARTTIPYIKFALMRACAQRRPVVSCLPPTFPLTLHHHQSNTAATVAPHRSAAPHHINKAVQCGGEGWNRKSKHSIHCTFTDTHTLTQPHHPDTHDEHRASQSETPHPALHGQCVVVRWKNNGSHLCKYRGRGRGMIASHRTQKLHGTAGRNVLRADRKSAGYSHAPTGSRHPTRNPH